MDYISDEISEKLKFEKQISVYFYNVQELIPYFSCIIYEGIVLLHFFYRMTDYILEFCIILELEI